MKMPSLTIEERVAQLFVVGSDTRDPAEETEPFYRYGLGGLLLFRHHVQGIPTAMDLREFLRERSQEFKGSGLSFIAVDQEGGQVERLPHWLFPTGVSAMTLGLKKDIYLCEQINREISRRLRWLGINLNFAPVLDLNREWMNPIIGVRAYGSKVEQVVSFARTLIKTHMDAGVLPVAKHFPGHGSGVQDSHLELPLFESWSEEELLPYEILIQEGLPAVMVTHGLYPRLAKLFHSDPNIPASLSEAVITQLLRSKMRFNGLIFTDDLMMNAVYENSDPVEVAISALKAGANLLVYRRAQPEAWQVFEALVSRFHNGKLSESLLDERVKPILQTKSFIDSVPVYDYPEISLSEEACHALALQWAQSGLLELHHDFISPLPFSQNSRWGLVAPDRRSMHNYKPDESTGKGILEWCRYYGTLPVAHQFYPVEGESTFSEDLWHDINMESLVFIAFNSHIYTKQQTLYEKLKAAHPKTKMILVSAGTPFDREVLSRPWIHLQMPSFRPAAIQALVQWLITSPINYA